MLTNKLKKTINTFLFTQYKDSFHFIDGDDKNIKITYKSDLALAETFLSDDMNKDYI